MELFIIIVLLVIAAETTYLSVRSGRFLPRTHLAPVFVDTSVLIDGRIVFIAESGFITRPLYIPRSVVGELQFLADNADNEKRSRARHGLDVITQLQSIKLVKTTIFNDSTRAEEGVDNRLLHLAKKHGGALCTIDYNLNKVAVVEGITVLNVNELAKTLRMAYLPGEHAMIELTQKGNDQHQGVGHLSDGTMVVVEQAQKYIGKTVEIEFIRGLQTAAGKMMFAKLVQATGKQQPAPRSSRHSQHAATPQQGPAVRTRPQPKQVPPKGVKKQQATSEGRTPRRSSPRRKSPEDSLIELANRSS